MSRVPRKQPAIPRSSELPTEAVAGRAIVPTPVDPRQADLFVPDFIPPCKPTLRERLPIGDGWQYEIKHDGYRVQAHVHDGNVRIFTKSGLDWSDRMPGLRDALADLGRNAVIDGEAVMVDESGFSDFFALHAALAARSAPYAILYAFDLLWLNGEDLRSGRLVERQATLESILPPDSPVVPIEHITHNGDVLLKHACAMGLEGVIAKRRDAPYRSGYVETWIKAKCTTTDQFAVIGFDPQGRKGVAALRLARLVDGVLTPCGWVGSGISAAASGDLRKALDAGEHLVVDVEFREWTPAGELRHAVFKGWHR